ncbi:MAG: AmmeMemoRadiSam system protein B [Xanthomonadales bacterium]|nr:AmmeMemoRadiSam system protein B [Xanthomonadales bacterium]NIX14145.1 AmmeMemoRadiSam system protein B [Xanthomonadales bacterium]
MNAIREPAVAGSFYPGGAGELRAAVKRLLEGADQPPGPPPKALIAPHAGYIYSGPVAASAYARLLQHADRYTRIVLAGPSHRVPVAGLATSARNAFRTPLGDVPVDREAIDRLNRLGVDTDDLAHRDEHCLEVHLPFLQMALGGFSLVPLLVGDATAREVAAVLKALWGGDETLIVVSSDLSHYLPRETARARDRATCAAIEQRDPGRIGHHDACGATPVRGLLLEAQRHGLEASTLDLRNSGDTAGGKEQVVGYGAWSFSGR